MCWLCVCVCVCVRMCVCALLGLVLDLRWGCGMCQPVYTGLWIFICTSVGVQGLVASPFICSENTSFLVVSYYPLHVSVDSVCISFADMSALVLQQRVCPSVVTLHLICICWMCLCLFADMSALDTWQHVDRCALKCLQPSTDST